MDNTTLYITIAGAGLAYWLLFQRSPKKRSKDPLDLNRIQDKVLEHVQRIEENREREVEKFQEDKVREAEQQKKEVVRKVYDALNQ